MKIEEGRTKQTGEKEREKQSREKERKMKLEKRFFCDIMLRGKNSGCCFTFATPMGVESGNIIKIKTKTKRRMKK